MAIILCLETATEVCSVCIHKDGNLLSTSESLQAFEHSKKITLFIQDCVQKAGIHLREIDAVAVSSGPGSYTGLRVGSSTAKGICFGLDVPLISVPSLQALVSGYMAEHSDEEADYLFPVIDARRNEVYGAIFNSKGVLVKNTFNYIFDQDPLPQIIKPGDKVLFIGNGAEKAKRFLNSAHFNFKNRLSRSTDLIPDSNKFFQQSKFENLISFAPIYYKAPNITSPKNRSL